MGARYPAVQVGKPVRAATHRVGKVDVSSGRAGVDHRPNQRRDAPPDDRKARANMGYGIGGILILILVVLAIVYFAKRV